MSLDDVIRMADDNADSAVWQAIAVLAKAAKTKGTSKTKTDGKEDK